MLPGVDGSNWFGYVASTVTQPCGSTHPCDMRCDVKSLVRQRLHSWPSGEASSATVSGLGEREARIGRTQQLKSVVPLLRGPS